MEDEPKAADALKREFARHRRRAIICRSDKEVMEVAKHLAKALFAVDLHMGPRRRDEGLKTIKALLHLRQAKKRSFFIAALTSHLELLDRAAETGVDAFLTKATTATDALELLTRFKANEVQTERAQGERFQKELAKREYSELLRQLKHEAAKRRSPSFEIPLGTIRRALAWPFLSEGEQLILSALEEELRKATEEPPDDSRALIAIAIRGAKILLASRGTDEQHLRQWFLSIRQLPAGGIFGWLPDTAENDN